MFPQLIVGFPAHSAAMGKPNSHTNFPNNNNFQIINFSKLTNFHTNQASGRWDSAGQESCREEEEEDGLSPVAHLYQDSITACGWCFYIIRYKRVLIVIRHQRMQHKSSHQSIQSEHYHLYCYCLQIKQAVFSRVMTTTSIHFSPIFTWWYPQIRAQIPVILLFTQWRSTEKLQELHLTYPLLLIFLLGKGKKRQKKGGKCLSGLYRSSMKPFMSCHFPFSLNL